MINPRKYQLTLERGAIIRLDTNFNTKIPSTNEASKLDYDLFLLESIDRQVPHVCIDLDDDHSIIIFLGTLLRRICICVTFIDCTDPNNRQPNFLRENLNEIIGKVEKAVYKYIDDINDAKVKFVTIDGDDTYVRFWDTTLYGAFYDLEKGYIEPPKVELVDFSINSLVDTVEARIRAFCDRKQ